MSQATNKPAVVEVSENEGYDIILDMVPSSISKMEGPDYSVTTGLKSGQMVMVIQGHFTGQATVITL